MRRASRALLEPQHEQRSVCARRHHASIRRRQHRRRVDDDVLVALLQASKQLVEPRSAEHFRRIRDALACAEQHQSATADRTNGLLQWRAAEQHIRKASLRVEVQILLDGWPAQVGIDEQDFLAFQLGQRHREVDRGDRLAFAAPRRSDHERLRLAVRVHRHEPVAQRAHLLCAVTRRVVEHHEIRIHRAIHDDEHVVTIGGRWILGLGLA